jgi:hypothetical protein
LALKGRATGRAEWPDRVTPAPCRDPPCLRGQGQLQMHPSNPRPGEGPALGHGRTARNHVLKRATRESHPGTCTLHEEPLSAREPHGFQQQQPFPDARRRRNRSFKPPARRCSMSLMSLMSLSPPRHSLSGITAREATSRGSGWLNLGRSWGDGSKNTVTGMGEIGVSS